MLMPPLSQSNNKKDEKNIDVQELTDYDLCDLYIRCVASFVDVASRNDIDSRKCFELGHILWENTIKARDDYRDGYSRKRP